VRLQNWQGCPWLVLVVRSVAEQTNGARMVGSRWYGKWKVMDALLDCHGNSMQIPTLGRRCFQCSGCPAPHCLPKPRQVVILASHGFQGKIWLVPDSTAAKQQNSNTPEQQSSCCSCSRANPHKPHASLCHATIVAQREGRPRPLQLWPPFCPRT
jgi:hypothetical protein